MATVQATAGGPVLVISEDEWNELTSFIINGEPLSDPVHRSLVDAHILDDSGDPTPTALEALSAAYSVRSRFQALDVRPHSAQVVEAWISSRSTTIAKHSNDGVHLYALPPEEVPSVFGQFLDLMPRPSVHEGPILMSVELLEGLYSADGARCDQVLKGAAQAGGDDSALAREIQSGQWTLNLLTTDTLAAMNDNGEDLSAAGVRQWETTDMIITLGVPSCLYAIVVVPEEAQAELGLSEPALFVDPTTAPPVWATITQWLFA